MLKSTLRAAVLVVSIAGAVAFADDRNTQTTTTTTEHTTTATGEAAKTGPSDPEIAAIVVAANDVDIEAGKLAKKKAKNKEVKGFANTMIRDHSAVQKQAVALVKKLGVTPQESDTSRSLKEDGKQNTEKLKDLKGAEFDRAYTAHEVTYHQQVVDAIRNTLIPSAKNAELKALLEKVAPTIEAHLEHAKSMQTKLEEKKG